MYKEFLGLMAYSVGEFYPPIDPPGADEYLIKSLGLINRYNQYTSFIGGDTIDYIKEAG